MNIIIGSAAHVVSRPMNIIIGLTGGFYAHPVKGGGIPSSGSDEVLM